MRTLIPHKMVVEFEEDGSFRGGVMLYRVKEDGILKKGYKSIGIKNAGFSVPQVNAFLKKVKDHAKLAEGIEASIS
jgi:hypothetical protein